MRYAQLIIGPAGSGKSTYCYIMQQHYANVRRSVQVVNLDPAAEDFNYEPYIDIRELIQVDDTMESDGLNYGPNGGLIYCMEYLLENISWLQEKLDVSDDEYIMFDCPGQLELYTNRTVMTDFAKKLQNLNFQICCVFIMDIHFMMDIPKFLAGSLSNLFVMYNIAIPHVAILNKMDLLPKNMENLENFTEVDIDVLLSDMENGPWNKKHRRLTKVIGKVLKEHGMIHFIPLNLMDEESVQYVRIHIDMILNYGEDEDVKTVDLEM